MGEEFSHSAPFFDSIFYFLDILLGRLCREPNHFVFICVSVFLFFSFLFFLKRPQLVLPPWALFWPLLAFCLINLLSAAWAADARGAITESSKVFLGLLSILYFINLLKSERRDHLLVWGMSLVLALVALFVMLMHFHYQRLHEKALAISFLQLGIAFPLYGFLNFESRRKAMCLGIFVLVLFVAISIPSSPVLLALAASLLLFLYLAYKNLGALQRVVIGCAAVIALLSLILQPDSTWQSLMLGGGIDRALVWKQTVALWQDHPLTGVGASNWSQHLGSILVRRPYNDLLWVLAETGLVGLAIILWKIIAILNLCSKSRVRTQLNLSLFLCSLLGLMVFASFSYPKEQVTHIVLAALLLSMLLRNCAACRFPAFRPLYVLLPVVLILAAGLFSLYLLYNPAL